MKEKKKRYVGKHIAKSSAKKKAIVFSAVSCLALLAVGMVSVAIVSAKAHSKDKIIPEPVATPDQVAIKTEQVQYFIDENQYKIDLDDLQREIEKTINQAKEITGGEWSVYVSIPSTGDSLSINQKKLQAASVIKMFVMGAVYEDFDALKKDYDGVDIDQLIECMIIISDNESADTLVTMLGRGDNVKGRKIVTDYCQKYGFTNTNMDRMILDDNVIKDNYTTTGDTAKFLEMLINGELPHSKDMLRHLKNQQRTTKIPAGVPVGITTANKTGELDDVQNDVAIIFTKEPYIICVMSDGVLDYQTPIDTIVDISKETYDYLVTKM